MYVPCEHIFLSCIMAFSICEVFAWLVCPVVGLLGLANDFAMLKNHAREKPLLAGYVMYVE